MPAVTPQRLCCLSLAACALYLGTVRLLYQVGSRPSPLPAWVGVRAAQRPPGSRVRTPGLPHPSGALRPPGTSMLPSPGPRWGGRSSSSAPSPAPPETTQPLPPCPEESPLLLGPVRMDPDAHVNLEQVREQNPRVAPGGRARPQHCTCAQKVAVVIPFRSRQAHLRSWLRWLHPVLQRQQLDYGVYVVRQAGARLFNRAKLLNVGFREALRDRPDYDCFVFSDVDLLPLDDRNAYRCFPQPRHLAVLVDRFGFVLPYPEYFGGVSALSRQQFLAVNGFSNSYWGWGGEDDDMFARLRLRGLALSRPPPRVAKFRMLRHPRDRRNEASPQRFARLARTRETMLSDGLSSLRYRVLDARRHPLFTELTVDIGAPG